MAPRQDNIPPQYSDQKYWKDGVFDEAAFTRDNNAWMDANNADHPGPSPNFDNPTGAIEPDPIVPPVGGATSAGGSGPPSTRERYWWENESDDRTNDGGAAWGKTDTLPDWAKGEVGTFEKGAQDGMLAAWKAGDEAGFNGIKDAERERIARAQGFSPENQPGAAQPTTAAPAATVETSPVSLEELIGGKPGMPAGGDFSLDDLLDELRRRATAATPANTPAQGGK